MILDLNLKNSKFYLNCDGRNYVNCVWFAEKGKKKKKSKEMPQAARH